MNEELQKALVDALTSLINNTQDFLSEQMPPLVAEIIAWQRWGHTGSFVVDVCLILLGLWCTRCWRHIKLKDNGSGDPADWIDVFRIFRVFIGGALLIFFGFAAIWDGWSAAKYWMSPRLAVLDYTTREIKNLRK